MSTNTKTYPGGFMPGAPAQNRREQWSNGTLPTDAPAGYQAWNENGTVSTALRALTAPETVMLAAQDAATTVGSNQATAQQLARTALTANGNDRTQDATIQTTAATINSTAGTFTLAQCTAFIKQLAQAVNTLAASDVNAKRELSYLLQNMLGDFTNMPS